MKRLLAKLGLIQLVWLRDFNGNLTLARKRYSPLGGFYAYRWCFTDIDEPVRLNADGTCSGPSYVHHWQDYGKPNFHQVGKIKEMQEEFHSLSVEVEELKQKLSKKKKH